MEETGRPAAGPGPLGWGHRMAGLAAALALLAILTAAPGVAPRGAAAGQAATVVAGVVDVWAGPAEGSGWVGQLTWGDRVDVYWGPEGDLYEINHDGYGLRGWVAGWAIRLDGATGTAGTGAGSSTGQAALAAGGRTGATAWVATDVLNIRGGAAESAAIWDRVVWGDAVTVIGAEVDGYVPIDYNGAQAWVWGGYLRFDATPGPAVGAATGPERWIDVDRSSGMVTLYEGGNQVYVAWGSMGFDQSNDGFYATANGSFRVYARNDDLTWTDWGRVYITDWVAFDPARSNGFHSFSRDQYGNVLGWGENPTYGCIALAPAASQRIYEFARLGTRVEVHW
ncbi:MAG: hypothetical protein AVDCRST_MAG73-1102 [uncultured Thermomicrobiales bacterium]|uniref:L,D-TPase catalytic domain-containing protein n=1 Tax=uncultured Thermomicrobiales bacterium TaxID=1645740 RepID=A0A6J4TUT2_9BACT|nr:MAG: hypothetical protein AVDCRST_MAG73-1102 [uncultured Thermomicrobiales bacterium]